MDASTSFSGGGFLNDSMFSDDKGNAKRVQNIVPVKIGEILRSSDELKIWGFPIHMLTIVGILRKIDVTTTKVTYEIEDDTGTITCLRWLEAYATTAEPEWKINTYVRVYGLLRQQNGKKHVFVLRILPLQDLNELTSHLLEVTYATLAAQAKAKSGSAERGIIDGRTIFNDCSGMTAEQSVIFKIIQSENNTECGIERSEIKRRVPPNILPQVDDIIDFLTGEGHIYTTRTDDHFKTT